MFSILLIVLLNFQLELVKQLMSFQFCLNNLCLQLKLLLNRLSSKNENFVFYLCLRHILEHEQDWFKTVHGTQLILFTKVLGHCLVMSFWPFFTIFAILRGGN